MNIAARLWKSLLDLARRPVPLPGAASQPAPVYALWRERPDVGPGRHRAPR